MRVQRPQLNGCCLTSSRPRTRSPWACSPRRTGTFKGVKALAPWESPGALLEAQRSAVVGARVLVAFAQGALALDRLRNGNRQTVQVQHVTVENGGQAVVAGTVAPGGAPAVGPASGRGRGAK